MQSLNAYQPTTSELEQLRFERARSFLNRSKSAIKNKYASMMSLQDLQEQAAADELEELKFGSRIGKFYKKHKKVINKVVVMAAGKAAFSLQNLENEGVEAEEEEQYIMLI